MSFIQNRYNILFLFTFLVLALSLARLSYAELVTTEYSGLDLLANIEIAQGKSLKNDGAVIIVHGTLSHGQSPFIAAMQNSLKQQGINSLAITLSLGFDQRTGNFNCALEHDHRHEDAIDEIGAWVNWLKQRNASKIYLFGFERGANQAVLYVKQSVSPKQKGAKKKSQSKAEKKKQIDKLILLSPLIWKPEDNERQYQEKFRTNLSQNLAVAQTMIDEDEGLNLIENIAFLRCSQALVTAKAFVNYYAPNTQHSTLNVISEIKQPSLAMLPANHPEISEYKAIVEQQLLSGQGRLGFAQVSAFTGEFNELLVNEIVNKVRTFLAN